MGLCGYGKILEVDLSTGKMAKREVDAEFARRYIGGMGFGCKILLDEVGRDVDPFGSENILVFANGPLTGTHAPCAGRTEVTTKSALTGGIGTGNTGGVWGATLKHAGYDILVVRNKAERPVFLWIDDDVVELRDASHVWGKDTRQTTDILQAELGSAEGSRVSVLAIGPAGENLVRYACTVNDYHHVVGRGGSGAVMGAKRLKAIAVRGTGAVEIARPEAFQQAAGEARQRIRDNIRSAETAEGDVIPNVLEDYQKRGSFPYRNYRSGVLPHGVSKLDRTEALKYCKNKESTCYACPRSCFYVAEVVEGKYAGVKAGRGHHPGIAIAWGGKCGIDNLPAIWKCKELCQKLGLDYISAAATIAFAMELFERGMLTVADTDGMELRWGDEDVIVQMLENIALRRGFGDVLAEGSLRAGQRIGGGAERYAMTIKGVEMMSTDPRAGRKGWAFGEITNPRGGDNIKTTHFMADRYNASWWVDEFDMFEDVKRRVYSMPGEEVGSSWEGKPLMCKWFEDLYSALNALGMCFFPSGMNLAIGPTHLSRLYSACTGWDTTPEELMKVGERIFNLFKVHAVRHGLTRKDDTWPDRFFDEALSEGAAKGVTLSRETINRLLDEYYELRGWDKNSGVPTVQKLNELGLHEVARALVR